MLASFDVIYALIMLGAIGVGIALCRGPQQKLQLRPDERLGIGIGAFCGAMIAAKLPFLFRGPAGPLWGPLDGAVWIADGKTILCGLVGGYLGVEIAKCWLRINVKTGDSFAVGAAAAVAIGRLACFRAGCCFGTPTELPWGTEFPRIDNALRHPTQLYESLFHFAMASLLYVLRERGVFAGQLMKLYLLAYFAYRFVTEWIRPEPDLLFGLTGYQLACVGLAPIFAWLWYRDSKASQRLQSPESFL